MTKEKIIPVILCGGSGNRLRPLSSPQQPKHFLRLFSDHSLLQETASRAMRISGAAPEDIVTVTLYSHESQVRAHYKDIDTGLCAHIITEKVANNTAPAIAQAALYINHFMGENSIMWVLPSDHYIRDEKILRQDLSKAVITADQGYLVTFGIKASRPETQYGYIKSGNSLGQRGVKSVAEFVEKPSLDVAKNYVRSGLYLWNSGMFVFKAAQVLSAFREYAPDCLGIDGAMIKSTPFDKAILEKSGNVAVVPTNPGWSDVGSWDSLWDIGVRRKRA